jgi:radical SAM superfamily enzyme YgiQ (UPF0313 family)
MARILFLQLNYYELHGPQSIAAVAESKGHQCTLIVPGFESDPIGEIKKFSPDVVGIGHTTVEREDALLWTKAIKKKIGCKVILGGIDPTFFPELALEDGVDLVCMGEGELTVLEILDRIDSGEGLEGISGTALNENGKLVKNPMRPLITELESLPFPRKDLYLDRYSYFRKYPTKTFMASRGCPHNCTYCANRGLRSLYPNQNKYVRFKSPQYLLDEIKATIDKYPARTVGFNDDLFTYKMAWLEEFLPQYHEQIGLPYFCCARIDKMTEEKAKLLAETGCYTCWYGLESAEPKTREMILSRHMSNDKIVEGAKILHKHGILTQSYNMMNIPGETFEMGLATLMLNIKAKNSFVVASLFQPFPGTELVRKLVEDKKLKDPEKMSNRETMSYFAFSPFKQKDSDKLTNLQKFFILGHRYPRLIPIIKKLCALPPNPLFDILFLVSFALDYGQSHRLTSWEVAYYNLRHIFTTYLAGSKMSPPK